MATALAVVLAGCATGTDQGLTDQGAPPANPATSRISSTVPAPIATATPLATAAPDATKRPATKAPTPKPKPVKTPKPASFYKPPGWDGYSDVDCGDFDTHVHAQSFFKGTGGSTTNDPYRLDADHDGLACETLP